MWKEKGKVNSEATTSAEDKVIQNSGMRADSGRLESDLNKEDDQTAQQKMKFNVNSAVARGMFRVMLPLQGLKLAL